MAHRRQCLQLGLACAGLSATRLGYGFGNLSFSTLGAAAAESGQRQTDSRPTAERAAPLPKVAFGRIERWSDVASPWIEARHVDLWLPPDFDAKQRRGESFALILCHDGQMLFDASTTWNQQAWALDLAAQAVMTQRPRWNFVIAGVWNRPDFRHSEYYPAKFLPHVPAELRAQFEAQALKGRARSDEYLKFLVLTLLPLLAQRVNLLPQAAARVLMGSSMGGLISLYGACEYPQVFGAAACLSTHWIAGYDVNTEFPAAALQYLRQALPPPGQLRLWIDRGTEELDARYADAFAQVTEFLRERGDTAASTHLEIVQGTGHNERAWAQRAARVLEFMLTGVGP